MKNLFWTISLFVFLVSCNGVLEQQKSEFNDLQEKTIEAHNVIMPKMGDLTRLSKELSKQIDSTNADVYISKKGELYKAHDDMMSWMHDYSEKFPYGYKTPNSVDSLNQQMTILKAEYREIEELKERTLKIIDETNTLLNK